MLINSVDTSQSDKFNENHRSNYLHLEKNQWICPGVPYSQGTAGVNDNEYLWQIRFSRTGGGVRGSNETRFSARL